MLIQNIYGRMGVSLTVLKLFCKTVKLFACGYVCKVLNIGPAGAKATPLLMEVGFLKFAE